MTIDVAPSEIRDEAALCPNCAEPPHVKEARAVIREWEMRNGHHSYVVSLDDGWRGYQAACWVCDWRGPEHLRGSEDMATLEGRAHKTRACLEAMEHREATRP